MPPPATAIGRILSGRHAFARISRRVGEMRQDPEMRPDPLTSVTDGLRMVSVTKLRLPQTSDESLSEASLLDPRPLLAAAAKPGLRGEPDIRAHAGRASTASGEDTMIRKRLLGMN